MKNTLRLLAGIAFACVFALTAGAAPETADEGEPTTFSEGIQAWSAKDYDLARSIFTENAEKGSPQAMTALGYMYSRGTGVPADERLATEWKIRARAASGDLNAQAWLRKNSKSK